MSKPRMPGISDPVLRMRQSRRGATMPPVCHRGVERIVSRYNPPIPEGLFGAQNVAVAEWNTCIFVVLLVVGQSERRGVQSDDGFCS